MSSLKVMNIPRDRKCAPYYQFVCCYKMLVKIDTWRYQSMFVLTKKWLEPISKYTQLTYNI